MCDIFPDVDKCCFVITLRVGMLFISILAIVSIESLLLVLPFSVILYLFKYRLKPQSYFFSPTDIAEKIVCPHFEVEFVLDFIMSTLEMTGVVGLSAIEQRSNIDYYKVQNFSHIKQPEDAMEKLNDLVSSGISAMSCIFMITGLCLFFGSLWDEEGAIQIFVWFTFFNVIFGFFMVLATGFECMVKTSCALSGMDWLSGSFVLVLITAYLFLWIYFICVANSYVMGIYT